MKRLIADPILAYWRIKGWIPANASPKKELFPFPMLTTVLHLQNLTALPGLMTDSSFQA